MAAAGTGPSRTATGAVPAASSMWAAAVHPPAPPSGGSPSPAFAAASQTANRLIQQVGTVVVGCEHAVRMATFATLAGGHCLFEDVPGLAKTLLVRTMAQAAGLQFSRIQFTPDLLPADITGSYVFNMRDQSFDLRRGPVFAQMLLADELNRAPPKTQAALLEAMQEGQVTLEGTSNALPRPFAVFATQNPIESEGVYPLPEAELDRFIARVSMGYPSEAEEHAILARVESWHGRAAVVQPVTNPAGVLALQEATRQVYVHPDLKRYIVQVVQATRNHPAVLVGSSPRGGIGLQAMAKAAALVSGRRHAIEDDVKEVAEPVLAHRILLRPEWAARGSTTYDVIAQALSTVPTPQVPRVAPA